MNGFDDYLEVALWSSMDGEDFLDDHYGIADISEGTREMLKKAYDAFYDANYHLVLDTDKRPDKSYFGHNLWLTQHHHGAGFWDSDYANGEALTAEADKMPEFCLYVGDDGKIYA